MKYWKSIQPTTKHQFVFSLRVVMRATLQSHKEQRESDQSIKCYVSTPLQQNFEKKNFAPSALCQAWDLPMSFSNWSRKEAPVSDWHQDLKALLVHL